MMLEAQVKGSLSEAKLKLGAEDRRHRDLVLRIEGTSLLRLEEYSSCVEDEEEKGWSISCAEETHVWVWGAY